MRGQTQVHGVNPNPNRHVMAFHFLRALAHIRWNRTRCAPSFRSAAVCRQSIRRAAYTSMAVAAGPRRVWSRVILCRLRRRRSRALKIANGRLQTTFLRKNKPRERAKKSQEDELRRLVPGGGRMDFDRLLEEAGNYIQCLRAQVLLMQKVATSMSR